MAGGDSIDDGQQDPGTVGMMSSLAAVGVSAVVSVGAAVAVAVVGICVVAVVAAVEVVVVYGVMGREIVVVGFVSIHSVGLVHTARHH